MNSSSSLVTLYMLCSCCHKPNINVVFITNSYDSYDWKICNILQQTIKYSHHSLSV